jgi:hypothetical protein
MRARSPLPRLRLAVSYGDRVGTMNRCARFTGLGGHSPHPEGERHIRRMKLASAGGAIEPVGSRNWGPLRATVAEIPREVVLAPSPETFSSVIT